MKKLVLVVFAMLVASVLVVYAAVKIKSYAIVTIQDCNVRSDHSVTSTLLGQVKANLSFAVSDTYSDYVRAVITDKTTGHKYTGWVWTALIDTKNNIDFTVKKPGANVKQTYDKNSTTLGVAATGSIGHILESKIVWYRIIFDDNKTGWVSAQYVKVKP